MGMKERLSRHARGNSHPGERASVKDTLTAVALVAPGVVAGASPLIEQPIERGIATTLLLSAPFAIDAARQSIQRRWQSRHPRPADPDLPPPVPHDQIPTINELRNSEPVVKKIDVSEGEQFDPRTIQVWPRPPIEDRQKNNQF